jgi:hypothetical protein
MRNLLIDISFSFDIAISVCKMGGLGCWFSWGGRPPIGIDVPE